MTSQRGVVYVAYGEPALKCLRVSVKALRLVEPDLEAVVVSDRAVPELPSIVRKTEDLGARSVKTSLYDLLPWEHTLYLDVDTVPLKPLTRFFAPLERGWEMAFCLDAFAGTLGQCRLKNRAETAYCSRLFGTLELAQMAGGAFSWRKCQPVEQVFKTWAAEWRRFRHRDQGALVRALALTPVKVWILPWQANCEERALAAEVYHFHGAARRKGAQ